MGQGIKGSKRGPRGRIKDSTELSLLGVAFRLVCLDIVYKSFQTGLEIEMKYLVL